MIPINDPGAEFDKLRSDITQAISQVLASGIYLNGNQTSGLEYEFADMFGYPGVVAVGSGTTGLYLALKAFGIGHGDEVIIPAMAPVAVAAAVLQAGATPVIVDVYRHNLILSEELCWEAATSKTRAIIPIHMYGNPAAVGGYEAINVAVIEDCSHAHAACYDGKAIGLSGDAGVFSCYPTKNLGGMGDAGLVVSKHAEIVGRLKVLRNYGDREIVGTNGRIDELQAAVLRVKLGHLRQATDRRREMAAYYDDRINNMGQLNLSKYCVYHQYVRLLPEGLDQDEFAGRMLERGVGVGFHYRELAHFRQWPLRVQSHRTATELAGRLVSLPIYPALTDNQVEQVVEAVHGSL